MNRLSRTLAVVCGLGLILAFFEVLTRSRCSAPSWTSANDFLWCASRGARHMPALHKGASILLGCGLLTSVVGFLFFSDPTGSAKQAPELSQGKD
jgi:hypothetical protein